MESERSLVERLADERRLLRRLRDDYLVVTKSRFHALRMMWFSLKALLGREDPGDTYAVWSASLSRSALPVMSLGVAPEPAYEASSVPADTAMPADLLACVEHLARSWNAVSQRPSTGEPIVSVVIPVYNNCDVTVRCLQSVVDQWPESLVTQVILVDDGSTDFTAEIVRRLPAIDYIRNGVNSGFIHSCNRGAAIARGRYICFLNNDTIVTPGWLDELVTVAERDPKVGAVGSKLIYPDGTLQEAGGLIWQDASGWNYGRGSHADDPRFNYLRDVDYCSGAALLVRTDIFERLGRFSELYAPAYYEDVDVCFAMRELGYRVVFQPKSVVVHDEGTSSGTSTDSGVKRHQAINKPKFEAKWRHVLDRHLDHDATRALLAARRLGRQKTILIIDNYVPEFDKDAGSARMFHVIQQLQAIGFDVIFMPDNYFRSEPYSTILQNMGVEVVYGTDKTPTPVEALRERLPLIDVAWVSRPEIGARWLPVLRERSDLTVIYDTVDLHFVRAKRELQVKGITDRKAWDRWAEERDAELAVIRSADLTIAIAESEQKTLAHEGVNRTFIIPTVHEIFERKRGFPDTDGILFIGGYQHPPNIDAALWLSNEIMPRVWAELPHVKLTLLGSNPPDAIRELGSERIVVPGYLPDVSAYFERARVFAVAVRFGAGLKAKLGHAFGYGLPTITTSIGAEGFGIIDGQSALIMDDADDFARAVIQVYRDESLWTTLSAGATRCIERYTPEAVCEMLSELLSYAMNPASRILTGQ